MAVKVGNSPNYAKALQRRGARRGAAVAASKNREDAEGWDAGPPIDPLVSQSYGVAVDRCVTCDLRAITDIATEDAIPALREQLHALQEQLHALQERVHKAEAADAQARKKLEALRQSYREDNGIGPSRGSRDQLAEAVRNGKAMFHSEDHLDGGYSGRVSREPKVRVEIELTREEYEACRYSRGVHQGQAPASSNVPGDHIMDAIKKFSGR